MFMIEIVFSAAITAAVFIFRTADVSVPCFHIFYSLIFCIAADWHVGNVYVQCWFFDAASIFEHPEKELKKFFDAEFNRLIECSKLFLSQDILMLHSNFHQQLWIYIHMEMHKCLNYRTWAAQTATDMKIEKEEELKISTRMKMKTKEKRRKFSFPFSILCVRIRIAQHCCSMRWIWNR